MIKKICFAASAILVGAVFQQASAQCAADEIEIEVMVETDAYGYEGYWSLVKNNNNCGVQEIANGGNSAVGCSGAGLKVQAPGGYGNMQTFSAGKWCVKKDSVFTLHAIDDWGDGGFGYSILANGYSALEVHTTGGNDAYSFVAKEPPAVDAKMNEVIKPYSYSFAGNAALTGSFTNLGRDVVTNIDVSYEIDNGAVQNATLNNLNIAYGEKHVFEHPNTFNVANGMHTIKVWTSNVNGKVDSINNNDTAAYTFEVGPGIPNIIDQYLSLSPIQNEIGSIAQQVNTPTDLDFHPVLSRKELWVINKRTENQGGSTVTFFNAGESNQTSVHKVDGNAWHFMSMPTGIAFSENENFANSPGVFDANHNGGDPFTGPALWSSDPAIHAQPSGGNGSHLDMLHSSPKCQGIAHEVENAFWVFDGDNSDIVRYDFVDDHGPGASYHGDAIVHRYRDYSVKMDPNEKVVSHMVLHKSTNWLYVVDYGNKRVMRLDITSGTLGADSNIDYYEPVEEYKEVNGYTWETVVETGLVGPAGIDVIENRMIVSDYATGEIIIYSIASMPAVELGRISTGAQGIMGVKIGPEGRIWYVDYDANKVFRIDGTGLSVKENLVENVKLYPNPSNGSFILNFDNNNTKTISVVNLMGQEIYRNSVSELEFFVELNVSAGQYLVYILNQNTGAYTTKKMSVE